MSRLIIPEDPTPGLKLSSSVVSPSESQSSSSGLQSSLASCAHTSSTAVTSPPDSEDLASIQLSLASPVDSATGYLARTDLQAPSTRWESTRVISVPHCQDISEAQQFITQELYKWQQQTPDFHRGVTVYIFTDIYHEWGDALFEALDKEFQFR